MSIFCNYLFTDKDRRLVHQAGLNKQPFPCVQGRLTFFPGLHHVEYIYNFNDLVEAYNNGWKGYPCWGRKVWR